MTVFSGRGLATIAVGRGGNLFSYCLPVTSPEPQKMMRGVREYAAGVIHELMSW